MRRWLGIIRLWFIKALEYRAELVVWASLTLFNTIIYLGIWISLFRGKPELLGYNVGQIINYYLLATIINGITASHFEAWRSQEVREGRVDHLMTKPVSYPLQILLADVGNRLTYITIILPLTFVIYVGYVWLFHLQLGALPVFVLLQFLALLIFGYLVEFSFALFAVFISFWFESGEGLEHFKWIIMSLFTGYMVPLEFMPQWLRKVVELLPLKYVYSVPIQIIQQRRTLQVWDICYIAATLACLYLFQRWLWSQVVKKYTSAGG